MRVEPASNILSTRSRDRILLAFTGDVDVHAVRALSARDLIPESATGRVTVDLATARFLDSGAITLLLQLRQRADQLGSSMTIVNVPASAHRAIRLAGVGPFLGLEDDTRPPEKGELLR